MFNIVHVHVSVYETNTVIIISIDSSNMFCTLPLKPFKIYITKFLKILFTFKGTVSQMTN